MFARSAIKGAQRALVTAKYFSTTEGEAQTEVPPPTQEEVEAGRSEWGIKYDDDCLKFEKEWTAIAEQV